MAGGPNWNELCGRVDEILRPYESARKISKFGLPVSFASMILVIVSYVIYTTAVADGGLGEGWGPQMLIFVYIIGVVPYLFFAVGTGCKVKAIWAEVEKACNEKSGNGYKYFLGDEHFGGCSKRHIKRRFILIQVENQDLEIQTQQLVPVATALPVQQPPTVSTSSNVYTNTSSSVNWNDSPAPAETTVGTGASTNGGTTSIFDQLKM